MSIKETLNRRPAVAISVAVGVIALAMLLIIRQVSGNSGSSGIKSFYSTDDGKTWFTDEATRPFPFDHNGAQAYRVRVFRCGGGAPFAGYLEALPEALVADVNATVPNWQARFAILQSGSDQILVKKPGSGAWVKPGQRKLYEQITKVVCPDGGQDPTAVNPNQ